MTQPDIDTLKAVIAGVHGAGVQQLPGEDLPGRASSTRRSRTAPSARPSPTRSTASASTRSPPGTRRSRATESCRRSTSRSTSSPRRTIRYDPDKAKQILDDAGWQSRTATAPGRRATRSSRSTSTSARSRRTTSRRRSSSPRRPRPSASSSTSRWSAPTSSTSSPCAEVDGKPAPDFDTFIWGWGGDPYDPSFLLSILTTGEIGGIVRLVLLEPRIRPALQAAGRRVRHRASARRSSSGWSRSPSATCRTWC